VKTAVTGVISRLKKSLGGLSPSTVQIVESLLWTFLARRSTPFSDREYGRFFRSVCDLANRIEEYVDDQSHEQDFVKYWLNVFMCRVMKDHQRPVKPDWLEGHCFVGWLRRCIVRRIAKGDHSFVYSLLQSKRAWPELSQSRLEESIRDHKKDLTTEMAYPPVHVMNALVKARTFVFTRNGKTLMKPFGDRFMPSGSACLQAPRSKGGALSIFEPYHVPTVEETTTLGFPRELNASLDRWRRDTFRYAREHAPEKACVDVVAIPEPGKFRIITKGDGYLYTALQPLQGRMLSAWKRCKFSTMTGDLTEKIRKLDAAVEEPFWCSGDYKAATDKMSAKLSEEILMTLPWYRLPVFNSFLANEIRYPDGSSVRQKNGQLMGHPLSFPILCVANLAVYWGSLDRWVQLDPSRRERANRMRWNVLINGDDILFKCDRSFFDLWSQMTKACGFVVSVGKNYFSPDAALINSKLYVRSAGKMTLRGYLNLKLVLGSSLKSGESKALPTQIGKDLSEMTLHCPWSRCAIPAAFDRWKSSWKGWFRPNWYIPVHLGGYGVHPRDAPETLRISIPQRSIAARFVADPALQLFRGRGGSLREAKDSLLIWNLRAVYEPPEEEASLDGEEDWTSRFAYAYRATGRNLNVSDKVLIAKLAKPSRLKPMSIPGLLRHLNIYWTAGKVPPCPPLCYLS
jgi:hypothetical protein